MNVVSVQGPDQKIYEIQVPDSFLNLSSKEQTEKLNSIIPSLISEPDVDVLQSEQINEIVSPEPKQIETFDTTGSIEEIPILHDIYSGDIGYIAGIGNAFARGFNDLQQASAVTQYELGLIDEETLASNISRDYTDKLQYPRRVNVEEGLGDITGQTTIGSATLETVKNPGAVIDVVAQSLVSSIPSLAGMIGGFVTLGPPGAMAGTAAGSYGVEYANSLQEFMMEEGVNFSDPQEIVSFLANEEKLQEAKSFAKKRGLAVAGFDAVSAGLAGKFFKPVATAVSSSLVKQASKNAGKAASEQAIIASVKKSTASGLGTIATKSKALSAAGKAGFKAELAALGARGYAGGAAAEIGVQALAGGSGEATAQIITKGKILSPGDVVLEAFGELVPGSAESAIGMGLNQNNKRKLVDSNIIDKNDFENVDSRYKPATSDAPQGTVFIRENKEKGTVEFFDDQNNTLGESSDISQNILDNNSDNILNDDSFGVQDSTIFRVIKNGELQPNFYTSQEEAEKSTKQKKKVNETTSTETKQKEKNKFEIIKEQSYVISNTSQGSSYNIKGYKFSDKYKAQDVVDNLNNNKQSSIDNRNKNFQRTRALFSLVNKDKARVNAVNKDNKKTGVKTPKEKIKSFKDFTEQEISNELKQIQNNFISPEEYASVKKLIYNEINISPTKQKPFSTRVIKNKLGVTNAKAKILYRELKNRNVLNSQNKVRTPKLISSKEIKGEVIGTPVTEGLLQAINDPKLTQQVLQKSIEETQENIDNKERESASALVKARKREAARNLNSTPKFLSKLNQVFSTDLKNRFIKMTGYDPREISINFLKTINNEKEGAIIDISTNGKIIINIAAQGLEGKTKKEQEDILYSAIDEEAFHVIEELASEGKGPLSKEDIAYLKKESRIARPDSSVNQSYYDLAKETYKNIPGYRNSDGSINVKRIESEAMAGMFAVHVNYKRNIISSPPLKSRVGEIFSRLINFFSTITKSLRKSGINNQSEVFNKIKEPTSFTEEVSVDSNPDNLTGDALKAKIIFDQKVREINESGINPESKAAAIEALSKLNYKNPANSFTLSEKAKQRIKGIRQTHRKELPNDIKKSMDDTLGPPNSDLISDGFFDNLKKLTTWPSDVILGIRKRIVDDIQNVKIASEEKENIADNLASSNAYTASVFSRLASSIVGAALGSVSKRQNFLSGPPVYEGGITSTKPVIVTIPVTDSNGNIVEEDVEVKGIADNLAEVLENRREEEFNLYRISKRQIELYRTNPKEAAKQVVSEEQAKRNIEYFEEKHPYFINADKKMTAFTIKVNEYLYKTGQISLDEFNKRKSSPAYHPYFVDSATINPREFSTTIGYELESPPIELGDFKVDENGNVKSSTDPKKLKGKGSLYIIQIGDKFLPDSSKRIRYFKTRKGAEVAISRLPDNQKEVAVIEKAAQPIDSLMNNYVNWLQRSVSNGMRNVAAQRIIRDQIRIGAAEVVTGNQSNASVWVNGKEIKFNVYDEQIHYALLSLMDNDLSFFSSTAGRVLTAPANLLRNLITKEPGFLAANFFRDSLSAAFTSGRIDAPLWSSVKGAVDAIRNSPGKVSLMRAGIRGGPDFASAANSMGTKELDNYRKKTYPKGVVENATKPLKTIWDWAEGAVEVVELSTRIAVRNDVMEKTGNEAQAIWEALEVLNFKKRGTWLKYASPLIPFLNARVQGIDVFVRGMMGRSAAKSSGLTSDELRKRFFIRASVLTSLSIALYLLQAGDEEMDEISDVTKDTNYVILPKYLGLPDDHPPLLIPGFFEVSLFLSTIPQKIVGQILGDPSSDMTQSLSRSLYSTLMPGAPTFVAPFLENAVNFNLRTGGSILTAKEKQDKQTNPSNVKRSTDSDLANFLAGTAGQTGPEWQNILNDLFGTTGSYVIALVDTVIPSDTVKPTRQIGEIPVAKRFLGLRNSAMRDFESVVRQLKSVQSNIKKYKETYDYDKLNKFKKDNRAILNQAYEIKDLNKTLKTLRAKEKNIRNIKTKDFLSIYPNSSKEDIAKYKRVNIDQIQKEIKSLIPIKRRIEKAIGQKE